MTCAYRIFSIVFGLSLAFSAHAGQPKITQSRLSDLLQQPTVSAIHRDRDGILWIGTQQGLHRYDGVNLTVFNSDSGNNNRIPDSQIRDIAEDADGNLLIATSSGALLKWNRKTTTFEPVITPTPIGETKLARLLLTVHGSILLLSRDHLSLYNPVSATIKDWLSNLDLLNIVGTPRDILEDPSGDIWVAGDLGIVHLILGKESYVTIDASKLGIPERSSVTALELLQDNMLLIGTGTGQILVWDINAGTVIIRAKLEGTSQAYISEFLQYEDQLLIGTDRGLYISDKNLSYFDDLEGRGDELSNPNIYSLLQDGKYIWIGTIDGLDILSFAPFELFNAKNSGIPNDILTFEEDGGGHLWVGTYNGLYLYDHSSRTHSRFQARAQPTDLDQRVATIAAKRNRLWLGLIRGGVRVVDTFSGRQRTRKISSNGGGEITKIVVTDESEDILIATYDQGLFRITLNETKSYYEDGSLPEKSITTIFRSKAGVLLAVSGNRLYRHTSETDQYRIVPLAFGLGGKSPVIYSFAQTATDDILIGTKDHGLFLWKRENQVSSDMNVQPFGVRQALNYSTIYGIEPDSEENVWCSTENGIVKLDPKGFLIKRFTVADGLQGIDYTLGASFTSKAGLIYFGGMNGYNRFDPAQIDIDNTPSPVRLTGISLPGRESKILGEPTNLKSLQLTHKDHFVTFQFSVLDFIDAEKNQFRYKLENFDTEWIESGTRNTATYTNLPAGDFVFRVQGANSAGIWNREGITLHLNVLPAPWKSWWAKLAYTLGLVILGMGLLRIYNSYAIERRSEERALEMFEAENRADDEMQEQIELQDEMVMASYQHNLTTLSLVSDCITFRSINLPDDVKRSLAESSIQRISALSSLEECLSYQAGGAVANLEKYTDGIFQVLLDRAPVRAETIITINEVTSMPLPAELASPLSIVIYELLENSFQHAFEQDSPANYIHVKLSLESLPEAAGEFLDLSFSDSGIGVPAKIEELATGGSGIDIVESIVTKLEGSLEFSGESGAFVSIKIPYSA